MMTKLSSLTILIGFGILHFLLISNGVAKAQVNNAKRIEGVYELVSEELNLKKPKEEKIVFAPPEWTGQWHFNKGYFASALMKEDRGSLINCEDLGFDSFAGTYEVNGDEILFRQDFSLAPLFKKRPYLMKFKIQKDALILTKELKPFVEDMSEGFLTITLRKK